MSIPFKTKIGVVYLAMAINCRQFEAKKADDGECLEDIKCIAKTVNPHCASCSLTNPNSLSADPTKPLQPGN